MSGAGGGRTCFQTEWKGCSRPREAGWQQGCSTKVKARVAAAAWLLLAKGALGAGNPADLAELTLEQLGDIEITSVSKREQRLADAPASVYVITREAILRAGVNTLPEALRLAPNLHVARINASQYAISARGFNSLAANKLQVLVDGRSVYTPLYSGVFWETQDVPLADVERIEVMSGPGGTVWGANAVNGVINIITAKAQASAGVMARAWAGNETRGLLLRRGWALQDGGALRAYAKVHRRDDSERANGADARDGLHSLQLGFRGDMEAGGGALTLQGDAYQESIRQAIAADQRHHGANLLARWTRALDGGAALTLQGYVDRSWRDVPGSYTERLGVVDLDVQYLLPPGAGGQWTLGGGHRAAKDVAGNYGTFAFLPASRNLHWTNAFAQYEGELARDVTLTLGSRVEHNGYSGTEWMPSARLGWRTSPRQLLWGSVSRAVRTPSRFDVELFAPAKPPYRFAGGPGFRAETANTLELGLSGQSGEALTYSFALFESRYGRLRNFQIQSDGTIIFVNAASARVRGAEGWARWQASRSWSLQGGFTALHEEFTGANIASIAPGNDPHHQFRLSSAWTLGSDVDLDVTLRRVSALRYTDVPAYNEADARLAWRFSPGLEAALSGRNLRHAQHREMGAGAGAVLVGRTVQLTLMARL